MNLGLSNLPLEVTPLSRDLATHLYGEGRTEAGEGLHVSCPESCSTQSGTPGLLSVQCPWAQDQGGFPDGGVFEGGASKFQPRPGGHRKTYVTSQPASLGGAASGPDC